MTAIYYAKDGQPIDMRSWVGLSERPDYHRVAQTSIDDGVRVSTVWLGIDHSFGHGPPLIFETMIFAHHLPEIDGETWRCSTEAEARAMHQVALAYVNDVMIRGWT